MPACAFKSCINKKKKSEGITFHRFPSKTDIRNEWTAAVRLSRNEPQWQPILSSLICSDHFDKRDIYVTKQGLRRIRRTGFPKKPAVSAATTSVTSDLGASICAAPNLGAGTSATPDLDARISASPDLAIESDNQAEIKVCRVCLAMDVKMFDMKDFKLTDMFRNVTGISVCDRKETILHCVCWECAARLAAAAAFKNKALFSNTLLTDIVLNKSNIAKLKRYFHNSLKSPLTIQHVSTSSDIRCGDFLSDEIYFENEEPLVNVPLRTTVGSDPLAENYSNIQIKNIKREIFSAPTDTIENSEAYYDDNNVLNEVTVMIDTPQSENESNFQIRNIKSEIFSTLTDTIESNEAYDNNNVLNEVTVMIDTPRSKKDSNIQIRHIKSEIFSTLTDTIESNEAYDNNNLLNEVAIMIDRPRSENDSNNQSKHMKSEIFPTLTDTIEYSDVYCNNNDKVQSEDAVMADAPINDYSYTVIATDEENKARLDVVGNTENESLSEEDTQSLEVSDNKAKKVTIRKVGASSEQGNSFNDGEKKKIIVIKEKPEETLKSDLSPSPCNVAITDENELFDINDITNKNHDGFNSPGVNDPGFDDDGIADTDVLKDRDGPLEENVLTDKENGSSDDSLPKEKIKTKNTKEKAVKSAKRVKKIKKPKIYRNDDSYGNIFTHTQLTFEEQLAEYVKRQESSNFKGSFFKCTACFRGFLDERAYNSHLTRHTDQYGEHECKICKKHFKHPRPLKNHMTSFHTQRFSCKQCNYVTTHRQSAKLHAQWHKGTKYKCPHCDGEFDKFTTYMSHLRIRHPSDFACDLCGYSFVSAKGLVQHKKLKHRFENAQIPEDGPLCEPCNVRFVSSEALKRHLRISAKHNPGNRESNMAKRGRKSKEELERRMRDKDTDISDINERRRIYPSRMKKAEEPIPCEQCGIELQGSRAYRIHFKRVHPEKNRTNYPAMKNGCMCEVCGKMFHNYNYLKDHAVVHTGEQAFKCDTCGKSFGVKQSLVAHQAVHSRVRGYPCKICEKKYTSAGNLSRHMSIHTGVRPYICEMCGKGFNMPSEKQAHISYKHLKKPWPKRKRDKR